MHGLFDEPRPRQALLSLPRGNGKSSLATAIGLYGLFADGEEGAAVLLVASDERQASIVDPFGVKDIPFWALEPLTRDRYGPELVTNLDLSGIYRVKGAAHALADVGSRSLPAAVPAADAQ